MASQEEQGTKAPLSLATGAALTQETFDDFVKRLKHDCEGDAVREHGTADAIFVVQARRRIIGIDRDYTEKWLVFCDDRHWDTGQEYWDEADDAAKVELDDLAHKLYENPFVDLSPESQWDILGDLPDHTVTGWDTRWGYVSAHFTMEAAEAFIRRKGHDYEKGCLRVYVEAQTYSWEYKAIKEALMRGELIYAPRPAAHAADGSTTAAGKSR